MKPKCAENSVRGKSGIQKSEFQRLENSGLKRVSNQHYVVYDFFAVLLNAVTASYAGCVIVILRRVNLL